MSEERSLKIIPLTVTSNGEDPKYDFLPEPLPVPPFRFLIVGSSGTGKTNLYLNLVTRFLLKPQPPHGDGTSIFSKIYVFSASARFDKSFRIFEQMEEFNDPNKTVIEDSLDTELINEIINREKETEDEQVLVIIDDFSGDKKALQDKVLYDLYFRSRHNNISVIFNTQYFFQFPIAERNNSNFIALFAMKDADLSKIAMELSTVKFDKENFKKAFKMATAGERYNFLFVDRVSGNMYKNFEEEIVFKGQTPTSNRSSEGRSTN
jgi:Poxvirus A32 protein